MLPPQG
jgi:hypothetical protein